MSSKLPKKLLPTKRAWKTFKTTVQTKLAKFNFNISTTIRRTKKYSISAFSFLLDFVPRKLYALTSRSSSNSRYHYYRQQRQYSPSFSAIYIDELFQGRHGSFAQAMKAKEMVASSSRCENMERKHDQISSGLKIDEKKAEKRNSTETGETSRTAGSGNARKLPLLPQFRGVDERAEEFISKFREERKLEREKSIIDFQEMLARSS